MTGLDILFVGEDKPGTRARQRVNAMRELGHRVEFVRSHAQGDTYETRPSIARRVRHRLRCPADPAGVNRALRSRAAAGPDIDILWIDYALMIRPGTYRLFRRGRPQTRIIWYSEDDMMQPHNGSVWLDRSIGQFDLWVTTKSLNARPDEMPRRGARRVLFVDNSYDRAAGGFAEPTPGDRARFGADVSFVGTYERQRAESIQALGRAGIAVRVWGNGWRRAAGDMANVTIENRPVYGDDLVRVYRCSRINLAFLRKINRDLQTCRTIEIPAYGGFMLHERTDEARALLAERREAAFFGTDEELISECRHWLENPEARAAVAAAGQRSIRERRFSHHDRVDEIVAAAFTDH